MPDCRLEWQSKATAVAKRTCDCDRQKRNEKEMLNRGKAVHETPAVAVCGVEGVEGVEGVDVE